MTDSAGGVGGSSNGGMSGGSTDNDSSLGGSSLGSENSIGSPTTAAELASTPTTSEALSRSPTTADQLSCSLTTAEQLASSVSTLGQALDLSKDASLDVSICSTPDKSINIGHVKAEYSAPDAALDTEKSKAHASVGLSGEINIGDAKTEIGLGSLGQIDGKVTVGTINAHGKIEAKAEIKGLTDTSASLKASAGAEAMAIDGHAGFEVSLTPKTVGDTLGGFYNSYVDPVVDYVAGRDIPEIPEVPDSFDHGLVIGGHVDGGYGASLKGSAGIEIGDGRGVKVSGSFKAGLGPVVGAGVTFGAK
ncbi:MAG: hypothetical protein AB2551_13485 [Candidatus Thiodiazotropha sp.]